MGRRLRRSPAASSAPSSRCSSPSIARDATGASCLAPVGLSTRSMPLVDKPRRSAFVCQQCGHAAARWLGQCPGCAAWNTLVEESLPDQRVRGRAREAAAAPKPLASVTAGSAIRRSTGLGELDRVLGGGLVQGAVVLIGGDPGIGKSTLALQACGALAGQGVPVLYVAGEESPEQVRLRADRLGLGESGILIVPETTAETVVEHVDRT